MYTFYHRYRGPGIGEALIRPPTHITKQEGADELFLVIFQTNYSEIRLYQKLGF